MVINFALASRTNLSTFRDTANKGDVTKYMIDCTPWAEDSGAVTSAVWSVVYGNVSIANQALSSGIASADLTFTGRGSAKIKIVVSTANATKIAYINIKVDDSDYCGDDYGQSCC